MRKYICLKLLSTALALLLCGCAAPTGQKEASTAALPDPGAWRSQNATLLSFVETELGYYILEDRMLYFAPTGSAEFHILCGRPDCDHSSEDCNAFAGEAFTYYDGKLYAIRRNYDKHVFEDIKISLDGSDHQVVGQFQDILYPDGQIKAAQNFSISGRYAYYIVPAGGYTGETGYETHIFRMDLSTGKNEELPASPESERNTGGYYYQHEGNKWYFIASHILEDGTQAPDYLVCMDMDDGTYTPITECNPTRFNLYRVEGRTIFHYQPGQGFFSYDMDSGEDKCQLALTDEEAYRSSIDYYDTDFIYVEADEELQIFNRDYQLIDRMALPNDLFYITATQDLVFFGIYLEAGMKPTAYINKNDIGSGNLELIYIDQ